jgi:dihydroorotase
MTLPGKVVATFLHGTPVVLDGELTTGAAGRGRNSTR